VAVEKLTREKSAGKTDFLCSARHFLSPKFPLISEISSFSTAAPVYDN
jgi:hypothetical protein